MHVFVLSENDVIRYVVASQSVRERRYWIAIGARVPRDSAAAQVRRDGKTFAQVNLDGTVWSSSDYADVLSCDEEAICLQSWGQTLSLITLEEIRPSGSVDRHESDEDDELLRELTGKLPWPRR